MIFKYIHSPRAPSPLGNYSHAVVVGELVMTAGMGPRHPLTNEVPGLRLDREGHRIAYDIRAETRQALENIQTVLEAAGSSLEKVVEVSVFLTDMADFAAYNEVYATYFPKEKPARTTVGVASLPGPIAIEMKVTALRTQ